MECGLKACIARKTRQFDFPDKGLANKAFEHSAEKLVLVAGLKPNLDAEIAANFDFATFWAVITGWNVERRYETTTTHQEAADLIRVIDDPTNGVLQWLKNYW